MSRHENFSERRQLVYRFARARVQFTPDLIRAFARTFDCGPVSIYNDLRSIEPETGCLLRNVPSSEPTTEKR
jgi:hypothetical protein